MRIRAAVLTALSALLTVLAAPSPAAADHSWNGYHWGRTANPFTLQLGDNVSGPWDAALGTASSDWSQSTVLDTRVRAGSTRPRNCRPTAGRVEVCNAAYGSTGWLGVARIWVTGGTHITQGVVKLNDTYFSTSAYNTTAWRNLVTCQEVGHTLGLDHQDEDFGNANLGTCMDYTDDPGTNQHPNAHDYAELERLYAHTDSTSTVGAAAARIPGAEPADDRAAWGQQVRRDAAGRVSVYVKSLARGAAVVTFVTWA